MTVLSFSFETGERRETIQDIKGDEWMNSVEQAQPLILDVDLIIKARVDRTDIQMLCKLVEGLGHLGIVTTTNKAIGEVMIQTTRYCWLELKKAIEKMPLLIEFI